MYCLKCGKDVEDNGVFCPECLIVARSYPIKPGTAIHIPHRVAVAQEKQPPHWRREPTAKEQLAALRVSVRRLRVAVLLLSLTLCLAAALLVLVFMCPGAIPFLG